MAKRNARQTINAALDTAPIVARPPQGRRMAKSEHEEPDDDDVGGDAEDDDDDDDAPHGSDDDHDDEDEDDDDDEYGKSMPNESDLIKAMDELAADAGTVASGGSVRLSDLMRRGAAGESLSKSEKKEMRRLLGERDEQADANGDTLEKSHREMFVQDASISQGLEMSGYLDAQTSAVCAALDGLRSKVKGNKHETNALLGKLAKGMHAVGMANVSLSQRVSELTDMVKSLSGNVTQPVGERGHVRNPNRTSRVGQPFGEGGDMQKSRTGGGRPPQGGENNLFKSKDEINGILTDLIKSTEGKGTTEFGRVDGVDLVFEQAKFEQTGQLAPSAMRLVVKKKGIDPAAVGL